jgi:hypothetical protein
MDDENKKRKAGLSRDTGGLSWRGSSEPVLRE